MPLITRTAKGSKLTISEMDGNLTYLEQLAQSDGLEYITEDTTVGNENLEISVSDGTNTSEIIVDPTQIEQKVTDGDSDGEATVKKFRVSNKVEGRPVIFEGTNDAYLATLLIEDTNYYFELNEEASGYFNGGNYIGAYQLSDSEYREFGVSSVVGSKVYIITDDDLTSLIDEEFNIYSPELGGDGGQTIPTIYEGDVVFTTESSITCNRVDQIVTDGTNFNQIQIRNSYVSMGSSGEGDNSSSVSFEPTLIQQFSTDGTNTSEIKVEPEKIEQSVSDGTNTTTNEIYPNGVSTLVQSNDVVGSMEIMPQYHNFAQSNSFNSNEISYIGYINTGTIPESFYITIDLTPFPIIGYADQTITFTQDTTSGNGIGFVVEVTFDNSGDIDFYDIKNFGNRYEVGDTITTSNEGSGALTITVDEITTSKLEITVRDGTNTSEIKIEPAQITLDTIALLLPNIPTYADNAAAVADDYPEHGVYKTSTGELRIVV
jgi:hypothetical protein